MQYNRLIRTTCLGTALFTAFAGTTHADSLDLSLSDDSVRGEYSFTDAKEELGGGVGYTYHDGSRHLATLDLHAQGRTAIQNIPMTVGLGVRNMYFDDGDRDIDGGATAPGVFARMNIPEVPGLSVGGSLYLSPSILSYGDADGMRHTDATVSYRLIRNSEIFAGYRYVGADLDTRGNDDYRFEEGLIGGMRILF